MPQQALLTLLSLSMLFKKQKDMMLNIIEEMKEKL